jgi:ribosome-binding factor A
MDNIRLKKVSTLLKETVSQIFSKEGANIYGTKCLVTVTNVVVTPDLSTARFYFSIFNAENNEETLLMIKKNASKIRGLIGNNTRHQLRKIPELEFYLDDTLDYVFKMENIFRDIERERDSLNQSNNDEA